MSCSFLIFPRISESCLEPAELLLLHCHKRLGTTAPAALLVKPVPQSNNCSHWFLSKRWVKSTNGYGHEITKYTVKHLMHTLSRHLHLSPVRTWGWDWFHHEEEGATSSTHYPVPHLGSSKQASV